MESHNITQFADKTMDDVHLYNAGVIKKELMDEFAYVMLMRRMESEMGKKY